ncbi:hypothetical protein V8C86DRAFT_3023263, partial [Haematococcus lacustris]
MVQASLYGLGRSVANSRVARQAPKQAHTRYPLASAGSTPAALQIARPAPACTWQPRCAPVAVAEAAKAACLPETPALSLATEDVSQLSLQNKHASLAHINGFNSRLHNFAAAEWVEDLIGTAPTLQVLSPLRLQKQPATEAASATVTVSATEFNAPVGLAVSPGPAVSTAAAGAHPAPDKQAEGWLLARGCQAAAPSAAQATSALLNRSTVSPSAPGSSGRKGSTCSRGHGRSSNTHGSSSSSGGVGSGSGQESEGGEVQGYRTADSVAVYRVPLQPLLLPTTSTPGPVPLPSPPAPSLSAPHNRPRPLHPPLGSSMWAWAEGRGHQERGPQAEGGRPLAATVAVDGVQGWGQGSVLQGLDMGSVALMQQLPQLLQLLGQQRWSGWRRR